MAADPLHDVADGEAFAEEADEPSRMSFLEHLDELRRRIVYSVYAILASAAGTFYFWNDIYTYLGEYFVQHAGGAVLINRLMGGFMFSLKTGLLLSIIVASPFVFSQVWLFVAPGLYAKEKRVVVPFVFFSSLLFTAGAAFAHLVAFPSMMQFFSSYGNQYFEFFPTLDDTFSFYSKTILGLGAVFQMPLLVFFLARFGILTWRFMVQKFKYAVLAIFVIAALITPSADIATQLVFVAPMLALYVISIGVAWLFGKKKPVESRA